MSLPDGTEVDLGPLGRARVVRLLGQGGQGFVHEVRLPHGEALALKWYRPGSASADQFHEMQRLVELGSPHQRFLWPISMARVAGEPSFGYVMRLRDGCYLELSFLLANTDRDGAPLSVSFDATISICRQLASSFLRLHARGMCYRDISFGNVFFDPANGDVLICDNDNVGVDDGTSRVLGTPFFMAPEVVRDLTFATLPSTDTDRHSLAVLLFYTLCLGHPFEGARTDDGLRDAAWLLEHFGTDPVFCLHPDRDDNRPSQVVQDYWAIYPRFLQDLFVQAFVAGVDRPGQRVTEGQWMKAMDRLRDGMVRCRCGTTGFWDLAEPRRTCRSCGRSLQPAYLLQVGRRTVAVSALATLRSDHLSPGADESVVVGRVRSHPQDADRWGLHNVSGRAWEATYAGGHRVSLEPDRTMEIADGVRVGVDGSVVTALRTQAA
jgi:DNA-binding helix-hairpin-helix protein with protein kinase domain